jgi:hypothetical protein
VKISELSLCHTKKGKRYSLQRWGEGGATRRSSRRKLANKLVSSKINTKFPQQQDKEVRKDEVECGKRNKIKKGGHLWGRVRLKRVGEIETDYTCQVCKTRGEKLGTERTQRDANASD